MPDVSDIAEVLRHLDPDYGISVDILGGVFVRPCPARRLALLFALDETFSLAFEDIGTHYDNPTFHDLIVDPDGLKPIAIDFVLYCVPDAGDALKNKIRRCPDQILILLVQVGMIASACRNVSLMFASVRKTTVANMPGVQEDSSVIASEIFRTCELLKGRHPDAYEMSWTRLRFAEAIEFERSRDRIADGAISNRVSKAENRKFQEFLREIGR